MTAFQEGSLQLAFVSIFFGLILLIKIYLYIYSFFSYVLLLEVGISVEKL